MFGYLSDGAHSVKAAGKIKFADDGSIKSINNSSGHYSTGVNRNKNHTDQVINSFIENSIIR